MYRLFYLDLLKKGSEQIPDTGLSKATMMPGVPSLKLITLLWNDCEYRQAQDRKTLRRINEILKNTIRTPFDEFRKLKPLRVNLSGFWSRRIDEENRLAYKFTGKIFQLIPVDITIKEDMSIH